MPLLSSIASASVRGFSGYGLSSGATFISASGGTTADSGNYRYHTFSSSGTFTVSAAPSGKFIDFIIVAGGGGAAVGGGAAGGGGGVVEKLAQSISTGSFAITVGSGGSLGGAGNNSLFKGETALGGGQGNGSGVGYSGGSGGGGTTGGAGLQPTSASGGYGNAGSNAAGGGGGSAASGNNSGDGYTSTTFNNTYSEGGPLDEEHAGPGASGSGGGVNTSSGISYGGANGIVIIRYLFQ